MGFTLFQACHYRYILPFSSLMQHQMHYGIVNEKMKLESYVRYVDNIDDVLSTMQAKKIGMSSEIFKKKTMNDWWLFGQDILCNNCADEIINVHCDYGRRIYNQLMRRMGGTFTDRSKGNEAVTRRICICIWLMGICKK